MFLFKYKGSFISLESVGLSLAFIVPLCSGLQHCTARCRNKNLRSWKMKVGRSRKLIVCMASICAVHRHHKGKKPKRHFAAGSKAVLLQFSAAAAAAIIDLLSLGTVGVGSSLPFSKGAQHFPLECRQMTFFVAAQNSTTFQPRKEGKEGELYIGLPLTSASCGIYYFFGFQGFDRSLSTSETSFESSITSAATLRTAAEMVTASAGFQPYRPAENTILSPSNSITPFPSAVVNNAIATPTPYAYHPAYFPSAAAAATHLSYG